MTKETIFDTIKECIRFLLEKNNKADKDCIEEYQNFLKDFSPISNLQEIEDCLFKIKNKYHIDMNDRYEDDASYRDRFLIPMMSVRTHIMFCKFEKLV